MKRRLLSILMAVVMVLTMLPSPVAAADKKAQAQAAEEAVPMLLQATAKGETYVKLSWNAVSNADKYVIYGAKCGNSYKEIATVEKTSYTVKKIDGKKLESHKNYKFYVVAKKGTKKVEKSAYVHIITANTSGKYGNVETITSDKDYLGLFIDDSEKVSATLKMYEGKKHLPKSHGTKLRYESSNTSVATVNSSGKVTAVAPGTATIYIKDVSGKYCTTEVEVYAKKYTIKFSANGGKGKMDPQYFAPGREQLLKESEFKAPKGMQFSSWNTKKDGTGTTLAAGEMFTPKKSRTLYAQWVAVTDTEEPTKTPTEVPTVTPTEAPTATPTPYTPSDPTSGQPLITYKAATGCEKYAGLLPAPERVAKGTTVSALSKPILRNCIFLGWYYDAAKQDKAEYDDVIDSSTVLYAAIVDSEEKELVQTPSLVTVEVKPENVSSYEFGIKNYNASCIASFINVAGNEEVTYTTSVSGDVTTIKPVLKQGQTYTLTLAENTDAVLVVNGVDQEVSIHTLNIVTEKGEVMNISLKDGMKFIPKASVGITEDIFKGLYNIGDDPSEPVVTEGTFVYEGTGIEVGDTVAIYDGQAPDERTLDETFKSGDEGDIAYVIITGIDDDEYSFKSADTKDILFVPDVLPVLAGSDQDGNAGNNSAKLAKDLFEFTGSDYAKIGLTKDTTVDVGDFMVFYTGTLGGSEHIDSYVRITGVTDNGTTFTIAYEPVTEDEVYASMDLYTSRDRDVELTDKQKKDIEDKIGQQAWNSGFVDEAVNYLTALAMETDGFKELSDDFDLDLESYKITLADGSELNESQRMQLMDEGSKVTVKDTVIKPVVTTALQHFENASGLRLQLVVSFTIIIGEEKKNNLTIQLQAVFIEEVMLSINTSGGAIWDTWGFIPYIDDYEITASLDLGDYTYFGVSATAKTVAEEDEFKWDANDSGTKGEESIRKLGKQLTDLMEEGQKFMGQKLVDEKGNEIKVDGHEGGGLTEKYAKFMEDASDDDSWIKLVEKEICKIEGFVDPLHVLCYGVTLKFIVKVNLYVTVGATLEQGEAKRYSFTIRLFSMRVNSNTVTLEEPHEQFDFYVFGTAGARVGLELELGVGLFSLSIDSIGVVAEVGIYAQFWGFFYAFYKEEGNKAPESGCCGAMLLEIGAYLEIKFKAQLFSNKDLTYEPTLYENQWPLFQLGTPEYTYDFKIEDDSDDLKFDVKCQKTVSIPKSFFTMLYQEMRSGEYKEDDGETLKEKNYDDKKESHFKIEISNPKFTYDPETNTVNINVNGESDKEECEIRIIWKSDPLAFTSSPLERVIKITWTDPLNARYISFNSTGGSKVNSIVEASGTPILGPTAPTKQGYVFAGWYEDRELTTPFDVPRMMPNYENSGIEVYAKWTPATDTPFKVFYYLQNPNGTYSQAGDPEVKYGTTESAPDIEANKKNFTGYELLTTTASSEIYADGTSLISYYYKLKEYTVTFTYGDKAVAGDDRTAPITYTAKYGSTLYAPQLKLGGYEFGGYQGLSVSQDYGFTVNGAATYNAVWTASTNTPYTVNYYLKTVDGSDYALTLIKTFYGLTDATVTESSLKQQYEGDSSMLYNSAKTALGSVKINAAGDTVIDVYYDRASYELKFMDNDTPVTPAKTIAWGTPITEPETPEKQGYNFTGWYTSADGATRCDTTALYSFANAKMPKSNLTLYAGWEASSDTPYTVEHYQQNADDDGYTLYGQPERFNGITGAGAEAQYKSFEHFVKNEGHSGTKKTGTILGDGSLTLKLYYDRETAKITFDANGGTLTDDSQKTFKYGQKFEVTAPTRGEDYAFDGWYDAQGKKYEASTIDRSGEFTLTAHWKAGVVNYTIEHYIMNTDGTYPATASYTDSSANGEKDKTVTLSDLKNSSYEVTGGIVYSYAKVGDETKTSATVVKNMTVKLYYERKQYTVTWNCGDGSETIDNEAAYTQNGTYYYGQELTAPVMSKTGYKYSWNTEPAGTLPAQTVEYTAEWSPITYTVKFSGNGASGTMNNQSFTYDAEQALSANMFVKTGHTFEGWTDTNSNTYSDKQTVKNLTATDKATVTLTAKWAANKYDIIYNNVEGATFSQTINEFTYNDSQDTILPTVSKPGSTFLGWYEDADCSGSAITAIPAGTAAKVTLYAKWEDKQYTITWNPNGGTITSAEGSYIVSGKYGDNLKDNKPAVERAADEGHTYEFAGWYTMAEGGTACPDIVSGEDAQITYYAHWNVTTKSFTIQWEVNDPNGLITFDINSPATSGTDIEYGTTLIKPVIDTTSWISHTETKYTGNEYVYEFLGWYEENDCEYNAEEGSYVPKTGAAPLSDAATVVGNAKYYAVWKIEERNYTVTWNLLLNETYPNLKGELVWAEGQDPVYAFTYGSSIIAPVSATFEPSVEFEFTFAGWYDNRSLSGDPVTNFGTITEDVTYYAKWTQEFRTYTVTFDMMNGKSPQEQNIKYSQYVYDVLESWPQPSTDAGEFLGWFVPCEGGYKKLSSNIGEYTTPVKGDLTLYAGWNYNLYLAGNRISTFKDSGTSGVFVKNDIFDVRPDTGDGMFTLKITADAVTDGLYEGKDNNSSETASVIWANLGAFGTHPTLELKIKGDITFAPKNYGTTMYGIYMSLGRLVISDYDENNTGSLTIISNFPGEHNDSNENQGMRLGNSYEQWGSTTVTIVTGLGVTYENYDEFKEWLICDWPFEGDAKTFADDVLSKGDAAQVVNGICMTNGSNQSQSNELSLFDSATLNICTSRKTSYEARAISGRLVIKSKDAKINICAKQYTAQYLVIDERITDDTNFKNYHILYNGEDKTVNLKTFNGNGYSGYRYVMYDLDVWKNYLTYEP